MAAATSSGSPLTLDTSRGEVDRHHWEATKHDIEHVLEGRSCG